MRLRRRSICTENPFVTVGGTMLFYRLWFLLRGRFPSVMGWIPMRQRLQNEQYLMMQQVTGWRKAPDWYWWKEHPISSDGSLMQRNSKDRLWLMEVWDIQRVFWQVLIQNKITEDDWNKNYNPGRASGFVHRRRTCSYTEEPKEGWKTLLGARMGSLQARDV